MTQFNISKQFAKKIADYLKTNREWNSGIVQIDSQILCTSS